MFGRKRRKKFFLTKLLVLSAVGIGGYLFVQSQAKAYDDYRVLEAINLGRNYLDDLKIDQAVSVFEKALEMSPEAIEVYKSLAIAYTESGNVDQAMSILSKGYELTGSGDLMNMVMAVQNGDSDQVELLEQLHAYEDTNLNATAEQENNPPLMFWTFQLMEQYFGEAKESAAGLFAPIQ